MSEIGSNPIKGVVTSSQMRPTEFFGKRGSPTTKRVISFAKRFFKKKPELAGKRFPKRPPGKRLKVEKGSSPLSPTGLDLGAARKAIEQYFIEGDLSPFLALLPPLEAKGKERELAAQRAVDLLNSVKAFDATENRGSKSTYELRTLCLQYSQAMMPSFQAYTYSADPKFFKNPFSPLSREFASDSKNYVPERQREHLRVLQNSLVDAMAMSKRFGRSERSMFCLAGNTAVGKSYWSGKDVRFSGSVEGAVSGSVNPDKVKAALRKEVPYVTNQQIHVEGAAVEVRLYAELQKRALKSTMLVDERLGVPELLTKILASKTEPGKELGVFYKDIDAPLLVSCLRVLSRDIDRDPCVPFGPIAGGFRVLRANRKKIMDIVEKSNVITYELLVVQKGGEGVVAAAKTTKKGPLERRDKALIKQVSDEQVQEEIDAVAKTTIDDKFIKKLRAQGVKGVNFEEIRRYKGLSIEEALLRRSNEAPYKRLMKKGHQKTL